MSVHRLLSKHSILTLTIISLLLICTMQQRGGSRTSSDSNRYYYQDSSRHHRGYGYQRGHTNHIGSSQNCTTVNGTTTCISTSTQGGSSWLVLVVVLAVFGFIGYFSVKEGIRQDQRRKLIINDAMKQFDARMEAYPSVYDMQVRQAMIDAFMNRRYTMVINVKDQAQKFYCQLKVTDLNRINDNKFQIKLTGSDEVGASKLSGLLIYQSDGLAIKLSKVYDDRKKAQQIGKFDVLLYQGYGNPDQMKGQWAFHGFQNSLEYSGYWYMAQL